jgi:hypothetical protein
MIEKTVLWDGNISMSKAKSLSEEQISKIQSWADAGDGVPEIQKKLRDEFEIRVTYLETRFLLEDLKIELLPTPEPEPEKKPVEDEAAAEEDADAPEGAETQVKVTVDQVLRPGAIISGKADFGGGKTASWWLDQMGRLGLDMADPEFRPSEEQAISFQTELRKVVQRSGF